MVELDWAAVQGVGSVIAALIAVIAYRSARRAAHEERQRNERQTQLDLKQGENIALLAGAVRKMADQQEHHILDLVKRVMELEALRDPAHSDERRREYEAAERTAARELRELGARLDTIILPGRDALAGGGPAGSTPKRVVRFRTGSR